MRVIKVSIVWTLLFLWARPVSAQDLGPHFLKIRDGIYVYGRDDIPGRDPTSNCGIIVTRDGVVLIDSGPNPPDSLAILAAVKKLTAQPSSNLWIPMLSSPRTRLQGTVQILTETETFYDVLLDRVGEMMAEGKSLDEIKASLRLPEYQTWSGGKPRLDTNIEAAYRAIKK